MKFALKNTKQLLIVSLMLIWTLSGCTEPEAEVAESAPTVNLGVAVAVSSSKEEASPINRETNITGQVMEQVLYRDGNNSAIDAPNFAFLGSASDIDRVEITVTEGTVNLITNQQLIYELGSYNTTLVALPIGSEIVISAKGLDITGKEIYNGNQTVTLVGTETGLGINLNPIDDGKVNTMPKVTAITTPAEIERALTGDVSITISGEIGDSYECQFLADASGGYYTPDVITITLGATTGTCDSTFTAPDVKTSVSHDVIVLNTQGNVTNIGYDLKIVSAKTDVGVNVGIAPSIDNLKARVTKKGVKLTAKVSDDKSKKELCYSWTYNGVTTAFKDATQNPVDFNGYNPATGGLLAITVRDENCTGLSTTAVFEISVGQWPKL